MAKKYFYGGDGNWATTGNWWNNEGHTVAAGALPATTDDVILLSNLTNLGSNRTVNSISAVSVAITLPPPPNRTLTCSASAIFYNTTVSVDLSARGGSYFLGSSSYQWYNLVIDPYNSITYYGELTGNAYFYNTSNTYQAPIIYGNVYAFNSANFQYNFTVTLCTYMFDNSYLLGGYINGDTYLYNNARLVYTRCNGNAYMYNNSSWNYYSVDKNLYNYNNSIISSMSVGLTAYFYDGSYNINSNFGYLYIDTLSSYNASNTGFYTTSGGRFNFATSQTLYASGSKPLLLWCGGGTANYSINDKNNRPITAVYFSNSAYNAANFYSDPTFLYVLKFPYANFKDQSYNNSIVLTADFYNNSYNNLSCSNASFYNSAFNSATCYNAYFYDTAYNTKLISNSAIYITALNQNLNIYAPWSLTRSENIVLDSTYRQITSLNVINTYNAGSPSFNIIRFTNSYNSGTITSKTSAVYFNGRSYNTGTVNPATTAYFNDFSYNGSGGIYTTAIINSIKKGVNGTSLMM